MAERAMRVRLGAFVAAAVVALTGLVFTFGGAPKLFSQNAQYTVTFPEAPGLARGTPVRKSGVRIGRVTALDIDDQTGRVQVAVEIEGKHLPRMSEEPVISRGLLSGDTTLDFIPKVDDKGQPIGIGSAYTPGTEIVGVPPLNTQRLINQAQGTIPDAQAALAQFNRTIGKFEAVGPKAERALDEIGQLARSAREVVPELRQTNLKVQEFIGANDPPADQPGNLKTLAKEIAELARAVRPLADDLRAVMKDNKGELTKTLQSVRQFTDRANDALSDDNRRNLSAALKSLTAAADNVNRLTGDDNRKLVADFLKNLRDGSDDLTKAIRLFAILVDRADTTLKGIDEAVRAASPAFKGVADVVKNLGDRVAQTKAILDNVEKATRPLADNAEPFARNAAKAAEELATTTAEVRKVLTAFSRSEGTLGKVVNDPQLYNQLVDAAANLNRTLVRAEKIAKDLEVFADKVARKPETIGVGGALRPSTGLKESPFAPLPNSTPNPAGVVRPLPPAGGGAGGDDPLPPVSSFKIEPQPLPPGPRVQPIPPVRPQQILGEPK